MAARDQHNGFTLRLRLAQSRHCDKCVEIHAENAADIIAAEVGA
jgi:hypothetical protein